jgi:hypothetical protein
MGTSDFSPDSRNHRQLRTFWLRRVLLPTGLLVSIFSPLNDAHLTLSKGLNSSTKIGVLLTPFRKPVLNRSRARRRVYKTTKEKSGPGSLVAAATLFNFLT